MAAVDLEKTGLEQEQLDDSGPYEEIPDDYPDVKTGRAPIGRLPSFISLDSTKNLAEVVDEKVDEKVGESVNMEEPEDGGSSERFDERLI